MTVLVDDSVQHLLKHLQIEKKRNNREQYFIVIVAVFAFPEFSSNGRVHWKFDNIYPLEISSNIMYCKLFVIKLFVNYLYSILLLVSKLVNSVSSNYEYYLYVLQ
jgi:hypothetical protein